MLPSRYSKLRSDLSMNHLLIKKDALGRATKNEHTAPTSCHASVRDDPLFIAMSLDQAQGCPFNDKGSPKEEKKYRIIAPKPAQTLLGDLILASNVPVQDRASPEISRKRHVEHTMQDSTPVEFVFVEHPFKTSKKRRCTSKASVENVPSGQQLLHGEEQPHLKEAGIDLQELRAQIQHLRLVSAKENKAQAMMITNLLTLASVVEIAVDVREAELRTSLSNMNGTVDQIKVQAMQLVNFSSGTSWLVTTLIRSALERHNAYLEDEGQQEIHRRLYEDATPNEEEAAIINEQLALIT